MGFVEFLVDSLSPKETKKYFRLPVVHCNVCTHEDIADCKWYGLITENTEKKATVVVENDDARIKFDVICYSGYSN